MKWFSRLFVGIVMCMVVSCDKAVRVGDVITIRGDIVSISYKTPYHCSVRAGGEEFSVKCRYVQYENASVCPNVGDGVKVTGTYTGVDTSGADVVRQMEMDKMWCRECSRIP